MLETHSDSLLVGHMSNCPIPAQFAYESLGNQKQVCSADSVEYIEDRECAEVASRSRQSGFTDAAEGIPDTTIPNPISNRLQQ